MWKRERRGNLFHEGRGKVIIVSGLPRILLESKRKRTTYNLNNGLSGQLMKQSRNTEKMAKYRGKARKLLSVKKVGAVARPKDLSCLLCNVTVLRIKVRKCSLNRFFASEERSVLQWKPWLKGGFFRYFIFRGLLSSFDSSNQGYFPTFSIPLRRGPKPLYFGQ